MLFRSNILTQKERKKLTANATADNEQVFINAIELMNILTQSSSTPNNKSISQLISTAEKEYERAELSVYGLIIFFAMLFFAVPTMALFWITSHLFKKYLKKTKDFVTQHDAEPALALTQKNSEESFKSEGSEQETSL